MTNKTAVQMAIPDAGPLITLAKVDALDLLLLFKDKVGIVITDVVHFEVTQNAIDHDDAKVIRAFLTKHKDRISIQDTQYGQMLIEYAKNGNHELPRDAGEHSIISFLKIASGRPPGKPMLVILEDSWFETHSGAIPGNVHLLSTHSFLEGLQKMNLLASAKQIWAELYLHGRSGKSTDIPAKKINPETDWHSEIDGDRNSLS
ncbi:hypothetical protein Q9L42_000105 (plasmid) [Methylomarinum sp. Ch1-1]|uniref:Uncharacterized protein n=1 Tax=Methylomarinum roseum TaxID=3067653 RepID=A0AAU7NNZ8_9GAMM|nr:hypothetical protein [Methylomarinum sp. Ch1-1]MDP4523113.1 hypothetical protein [Methylomarinum sp. Ch1-1]